MTDKLVKDYPQWKYGTENRLIIFGIFVIEFIVVIFYSVFILSFLLLKERLRGFNWLEFLAVVTIGGFFTFLFALRYFKVW